MEIKLLGFLSIVSTVLLINGQNITEPILLVPVITTTTGMPITTATEPTTVLPTITKLTAVVPNVTVIAAVVPTITVPEITVPTSTVPELMVPTSTVPELIVPSIPEADLLVANYDNILHRLKGFAIRQPLILHCNVTKEGEHQLVWKKNGKDVSDVPDLDGRYRIIDAEHKFMIERTHETDTGHYSCHLNNTRKEFHVMSEVLVRSTSNIGVSQGEIFTIPCDVVGSQPKIYWKFGNLTIHNSTGRYTLKDNSDGVPNAILRVVNASLEDRGEYTCFGGNLLTDLNVTALASDVTMVRIKDSMASVWPAIGIVAELFIMCITTCIFKRLDKDRVLDED